MEIDLDLGITNGVVKQWGKAGQMQLVAAAPIAEGEPILIEEPLLYRLVAERRYTSCQWDLVNDLLRFQHLRRKIYSWNLCKDAVIGTDDSDSEIARELSAIHNTSVNNVFGLYSVVSTNNIGFSDAQGETLGYGMFELLSRSNHSCVPSSKFMGNGDPDAPVTAAIALRDPEIGDPITWSYLDFHSHCPNAEVLDFHVRNWLLVDHYGFACQCDLCNAQIPEQLKGQDVYSAYRHLILNEAERIFEDMASRHPPGALVTIPRTVLPGPSPWV